jgi:predicted deacylase
MMLALSVMGRSADITVGPVTARAGQKSTGFIQVPAGVDAASNIPVIVVNGAKPGPILALVAGSHGTEYASIVALEKLAQTADPATLSGALIIVPLVNPASFAQKVPHLNPVDGKNMNRFFPGKPDGTQTERVSFAIAQQVIEKCD